MAKRGWTIWAKDNERTRMYSIAESDRIKARELLKSKLPAHFVLISDQELPGTVVDALKLPAGKAMEWVPLDPTDKIEPKGTPIP